MNARVNPKACHQIAVVIAFHVQIHLGMTLCIGQRPGTIHVQLVGPTGEIDTLPQQRIALALKIDIRLADFVTLQPEVFDGQGQIGHPLMELAIKIGNQRQLLAINIHQQRFFSNRFQLR